jgi:murein DD-endopeptidase MepM/ murein hydrolase activator NlpD
VYALALAWFLCRTVSAEDLPWPIDADRIITSTFAEPRPGRFHLGIDFTSGGTTGRDVYAIGDGYISSVATSPFGYGKLLEFRLTDGRTVRYGHLSEFSPEIEDRLETLRGMKHTYDVELALTPGEFPARKGEVICRSGESGSSAPHLHLELRDKTGSPLNLLAWGLAVPDTVPPEIGEVTLIPLDRESSVDGSPLPARIDLRRDEPPHLSGRIGAAAVLMDRTGPYTQHLGVYRAELSIDTGIVFSKRYDRMNAADGRYGGMDYLAAEHYGADEFLSALFRREGNPLGWYGGNGIPPIRPGTTPIRRTLRITAGDYAGNESSKDFPVVFGGRPVISECSFTAPGVVRVAGKYGAGGIDRVEFLARKNGEWGLVRAVKTSGRTCTITESFGDSTALFRVRLVACDSTRSLSCDVRCARPSPPGAVQPRIRLNATLLHDCVAAVITADGSLGSLPVLRCADPGGRMEEIPAAPLGDRRWVASAPLGPGRNFLRISARALDSSLREISDSLALDITRIEPSSEEAVYAPDGRFSLHALPGSVYRPAPVCVEKVQVNPPPKLIPASNVYRVSWGDDPIKGPCYVTFHLESEPPSRALMYVSADGNRWSCLSGQRPGRLFSAVFTGSGCLGMFVDETEPEVVPLEPAPGGAADSRKPVIRFRAGDDESGIGGSNAIILFLDSRVVYGEYNPARKVVCYPVRKDLAAGMHRVDVRVTDRAGNRKGVQWEFSVR